MITSKEGEMKSNGHSASCNYNSSRSTCVDKETPNDENGAASDPMNANDDDEIKDFNDAQFSAADTADTADTAAADANTSDSNDNDNSEVKVSQIKAIVIKKDPNEEERIIATLETSATEIQEGKSKQSQDDAMRDANDTNKSHKGKKEEGEVINTTETETKSNEVILFEEEEEEEEKKTENDNDDNAKNEGTNENSRKKNVYFLLKKIRDSLSL